MTRCEICGNQWDNSLMYIQADGRTVCVHCLNAEERAEKMKTVEQHNAELVDTIKRTITNLKAASESNPKRVPSQPLDCKENYERHLALIDQYLYIAVSELTRAVG